MSNVGCWFLRSGEASILLFESRVVPVIIVHVAHASNVPMAIERRYPFRVMLLASLLCTIWWTLHRHLMAFRLSPHDEPRRSVWLSLADLAMVCKISKCIRQASSSVVRLCHLGMTSGSIVGLQCARWISSVSVSRCR